jgi:trehalose 6-phosphate synthase/phosphatase
MPERRLVVVSNRLPVTISNETGEWTANPSSGGLASAMAPILKKTGGLWIGWTGDDGSMDKAERDRLLEEAQSGFEYVPVDFPDGEGSAFYEGYPNQTVWPLFHYFPSRMNFLPDSWHVYEKGNRTFADRVAERAREGDLIWVHDYHLMLLPELIRESARSAKIGFFLHIPFPASEVFSMLPRGDEVLRGLLGADLIAFHTYRHLHHFRSSLLRIAGIESAMDSVEFEGRTVRLEALPIGIAPEEFSQLVDQDAGTAEHIHRLRTEFEGKRLIVAVDRLDYSKGIPERFRAFRSLLRKNPEFKENVVLVQVAVPSREGIGEYQNLRSEINELAGEINGEFATPHWTPLVYMRHPVDRSSLAALYAVAEVAWVTPLRDGMNLVAKEYCATKTAEEGVLVLSQFAGAAAEMGEALLVNPFDEERVAEAIQRALNMPAEERMERMRRLRERVIRNDVFHWAERFIGILESVEPAKSADYERLDRNALLAAYRSAEKRLLILDYDGTLVAIQPDPSRTAPAKDLLSVLTSLAADEKNVVAVVSGRRSQDLQRWLGEIPQLILAAEHGGMVRCGASGEWQSMMPPQGNLEWKPKVRDLFQHFVDRAPGSFIEEKEFSVVWHYRRVEPEFGEWLAGELTALLGGLLADTDAHPTRGRKIVEVRPAWANKGAFTSSLIAKHPDATFRLAAGDDLTDEDVFDQMPDDAFTFHVGKKHGRARYSLSDHRAAIELLKDLAG